MKARVCKRQAWVEDEKRETGKRERRDEKAI